MGYILGEPLIKVGDPSNLNIPCCIGHLYTPKAYIDPRSPINIMTRDRYNAIMKEKLGFRMFPDTLWISNFTGRVKGLPVYVGTLTYILDFMIVEDIRPLVDDELTRVILGKPFIETSRMTHNPTLGIVRFKNETDEINYQMPHYIEQYKDLTNFEKEYKEAVYYRNQEDRRRGVDYVMRRIIGFYKDCVKLGPEYETGRPDETKDVPDDEVT